MGTKTIWDGKDLPPIGCQVLISLASVGTVTLTAASTMTCLIPVQLLVHFVMRLPPLALA